MKKITIEIPTMYADHHVLEVRRILLELPGIDNVYASSAFGIVEVTYDPQKTNDLEIKMKLDEAGYLSEWSLPVETNTAVSQETVSETFFRHTDVFETSRQVVSFAQKVSYIGRPLWPCPGMGLISKGMEDL